MWNSLIHTVSWKQYLTFTARNNCLFMYSFHLFTDKKRVKKDSIFFSDSSIIIINDCVLWTVTCQIVTFLSAETSLNLEPCLNWRKTFFVCMCVFHDSEKLFMHSHYFLNLLSKYLKCTVKIYFLSLLADCFLFCRAKKKIKIINHLQLHSACVHLFSRLCPFLCITSHSGEILLISYLDQCLFLFFLHITSRQMVRFSVQITLDM